MNKQQTVAITGANGFLGGRLAAHFQQQGWQVVALVRRPDEGQDSGVRYAAYDLTKPVDDSMLKGVDLLVHTAYVKQGKDYPKAMNVNVTAAKRLLTASRKNKVKKNVFISSMSAHDAAESVYGRQKLAIEKLFAGKQDVVLRCGLIIGNGGIVKQMVDFMRTKHAVPLVGGGGQPLQTIAVYDLARIIEKLYTDNIHGLFTVATPKVLTYREFYQIVSRSLQLKVLFIPIPYSVLVGMIKMIRALHLPLAVSEENVLGLKHLIAVDTTSDLKKIDVELDSLETALQKSGVASA